MPIYLDYAATTPVDERVAAKMMQYLTVQGDYGNPASTHYYGETAKQAVEQARCQVANLINADPREIIWTSGATEADNLALKGAAHFYQRKGRHIITCKTEHKAVLDTCKSLEAEGFEVTYLTPLANGLIDLAELTAVIRDDTIMVSIMHVNNEIGVIQDIAKIGAITRECGIIFHCDAAQSIGKVPLDMQTMQVDLLSLTSHKIYGPKGIGALYVRQQPRVRLVAMINGGGHERGLRSGTLATHQIVGMGQAYAIAQQEMAADNARLTQLRHDFLHQMQMLDEVYINGDQQHCVPGIMSISFNYTDGEALLMVLSELAISTASACSSASIEPSHVLQALGMKPELAHGTIRVSIGRFTTADELTQAADIIIANVKQLREISPVWEQHQHGTI